MESLVERDRHWPELHRARRAVLVVDVAESVRLMQEHEDDVIDRWRRFVLEVRSEILPKHEGRLVKSLGDGMLLQFEHTPRALRTAFELQRLVAKYNEGKSDDCCLRLRIGLHVDEVVADELDLYGSGVNLAARLSGLARPGGVAASTDAVDELLPGLDAQMEDAGTCYLKHIKEPVQVYHLHPSAQPGEGPGDPARESLPFSPFRQETALATCVALVPISFQQGDQVQGTIAELASDMLLSRLSTVPQLRVISRLSTEQFRLRGLDTRAIARHTAASYLISGRLHGSGAQAALYLELMDAEEEAILWAKTAKLTATDLLAPDETLTPEIAQEIVDSIVSHQLRKVSTTPLPNIASQTLQFSAIHLMHRRSLTDFGRAHEILEYLVDRHPTASAPHAWLAKWHVLRITKGWVQPTNAEGERALAHTRRALDLNPDSAMTMAMEGFVYCHMKLDLGLARQRLEGALEVNSNEPWVWLVRATVESLLDHGESAWQCALRARNLSPMDPLKHYYDALAASAAVAAQRFSDAERLARLSLSKDARHLPTLRALAIAQVHLGDLPAARETVANVLELQPDFNLTRYVSGAPRGAEEVRRRWASALREAGAPA
jgi:class 3 adenylate cyclase/TolB-like protein/Flp pilus assembly protein TadD